VGCGTILVLALLIAQRGRDWYLAYHFSRISFVVVDGSAPGLKKGFWPGAGRVRFVTRNGTAKWTRVATTSQHDFCPKKGLALDPERSRIYVQDFAGPRILALDATGNVLFTINQSFVMALCVDPKTGDLWCLEGTVHVETPVYDPRGKLVVSHPWGGMDIAYSSFDDSFWIVGDEILKVDRTGRELARGPKNEPNYYSVAPDHHDGSVWVTVTFKEVDGGHVLHLEARGKLLREVKLPNELPIDVACESSTSMAWVVDSSGDVVRIPAEGEPLKPMPFDARRITLSERTGTVWLSTENKVIALNPAGEVLAEHGLDSANSILWIAAP
jgi:DNA-binding beta-propeller fold protein YncE